MKVQVIVFITPIVVELSWATKANVLESLRRPPPLPYKGIYIFEQYPWFISSDTDHFLPYKHVCVIYNVTFYKHPHLIWASGWREGGRELTHYLGWAEFVYLTRHGSGSITFVNNVRWNVLPAGTRLVVSFPITVGLPYYKMYILYIP